MQGQQHSASKGVENRRQFLRKASSAAAGLWVAAHWSGAHGPGLAEAALAQPSDQPFPLGMASYSLRSFPLDKALAMTAELRLKHLCLKSFHLPLDASQQQIAEAVAKVKQAGLDLYAGGVISMRNEKEVNQAFDYAKAAGMRMIIAMPLPDVLPLLEKKVRAYGIRIAIHNHGPGDKVYPTPESAYEKIQSLDKRIGLCLDLGHTVRVGADPDRSARQCADRLFDVHLKDVSAATPAGKEIEVGRGVIDIPKFLRTLKEIRYAGVLAFEYEKDPKDPMPGLKESVAYVRRVMGELQ